LRKMGGGQSRDDGSVQSEAVNAACTSVSVVEIINLMMPVYYTRAEISNAELDMVKQSWQLVLDNKCAAFFRYRELKGSSCNANDCVEFFSINFYSRLFDVSPVSRALFKDDVKIQGAKLIKMMSLAINEYGNRHIFEGTLIKLADFHNSKGVQAVEYGIVGEVLFWALAHTIGPETFTSQHRDAWIKVYCRMLTVIIPVAVAYQAMDATKRANALTQRMKNYDEYSRTHVGDTPKVPETQDAKKGVDEDTVATKGP